VAARIDIDGLDVCPCGRRALWRRRRRAPGWLALWGLAMVVLALALAACGARSSLPDAAAGGAGASSSGSGAGAAGGGDQPGGAGGVPCQAWSLAPGEPIALTDAVGDSLLTSVAVEGNSVLVATMNDNDPSPDPAWRVRRLSADLSTLGPSQIALTHAQGVSLSGGSLASDFGHRGLVAWDDVAGCRFVALSADGAPAAAPLSVADRWCFWLRATAGGFTAFASVPFAFSPLSMLMLAAQGQLVASQDDLVPASTETTFPRGRAKLSDGSTPIVWSAGSASIMVQRFSETGEPLSSAEPLLAPADGLRFAIGARGNGALVAWASGAQGTGELQVEPVDADGHPTGPATTIAADTTSLVGHISLAAVGDGALLAWSKGPQSGAYQTMTVQQITAAGLPVGAPISVPTPQFIGGVALVPTAAGVLILFDAEAPATLTQVFALRLVCSG